MRGLNPEKIDLEILKDRITQRAVDMLDHRKFDLMFDDARDEADTQREAYEALEKEFMDVWGQRRFSSFESFYQSWIRRVRENLNTD